MNSKQLMKSVAFLVVLSGIVLGVYVGVRAQGPENVLSVFGQYGEGQDLEYATDYVHKESGQPMKLYFNDAVQYNEKTMNGIKVEIESSVEGNPWKATYGKRDSLADEPVNTEFYPLLGATAASDHGARLTSRRNRVDGKRIPV